MVKIISIKDHLEGIFCDFKSVVLNILRVPLQKSVPLSPNRNNKKQMNLYYSKFLPGPEKCLLASPFKKHCVTKGF